MSNFHYNDQGTCKSCFNRSDYVDLAETANYNCDLPCLCRYTSERSDKDKMYYDYFVLGQPMNLAPMRKNGESFTGPHLTHKQQPSKISANTAKCCGRK